MFSCRSITYYSAIIIIISAWRWKLAHVCMLFHTHVLYRFHPDPTCAKCVGVHALSAK